MALAWSKCAQSLAKIHLHCRLLAKNLWLVMWVRTLSKLELEFGNVSFWGEGKTGVPGEKLLGAEKRTNNKLNPHMTPGHMWDSVVNTARRSGEIYSGFIGRNVRPHLVNMLLTVVKLFFLWLTECVIVSLLCVFRSFTFFYCTSEMSSFLNFLYSLTPAGDIN